MLQNISFKNLKPDWQTGQAKKQSSDKPLTSALSAAYSNRLSENKNPFGPAATLELTHSYTGEKSFPPNMAPASESSARTLKTGSRGNDVKLLQANLNLLGYNAGIPDGKYGNATKNAVISFQKTYGLTPDGVAGNNTLAAIRLTVNRKHKNLLSKGQIGNAVRNLQSNLISLGFLSGKADGVFGKNTDAAVKAFQKKHGLTPDGIVGDSTRNKLAKAIKTRKKSTAVTQSADYKPIKNGKKTKIPAPGTKIEVSLGTDKPSITATVANEHVWSIEFSIKACRKKYPNEVCTQRLNTALEKFQYNSGKNDLLQLEIPGVGKCYAGAMAATLGSIGDVTEVTLDDGTKFNFMILDEKNIHHKSKDFPSKKQCQNTWGHGYMQNSNREVQLNVCEFITSQSLEGKHSAKHYPSGAFLQDRYVKSVKVIGHANIE